MGWAKYMEDDMEIMQTRNANWNLYDFSYPQTQIAKQKKAPSAVPSPSDRDSPKALLTLSRMAGSNILYAALFLRW